MSQNVDNKVLDLLMQKGFKPYEYMSGFEMFKERLPGKEQFHSSLTGKKISDKKYEHVLKILDRSEMKMIKDYHNMYLKSNLLLSVDVLENFKNSSLKNKGLFPSHYLSASA